MLAGNIRTLFCKSFIRNKKDEDLRFACFEIFRSIAVNIGIVILRYKLLIINIQ